LNSDYWNETRFLRLERLKFEMETEPKQILCLPLEIEQSQLLYLPKETTNIISNIMELPK